MLTIRVPFGFSYEHEHFSEKEALENFRHLRSRLNEQLRKTKNILEVADAVAVQKNYPVLESFYKDLNGEEIMTKNFRSEAHKATEEINKWVKEKTHDKIQKLFGQDLDASTAMVLLNAVFFKGVWKHRFNHTLTMREPFNYFGKGGVKRSEQVEMMNIRGTFGHAHFEDGDLLEVPFVNDSTVFLAFLPSEKHSADLSMMSSISALFGASEESVNSVKFADRLAHVRPHREVKVHLPKFKIESKYSLNAALKHLGLRDAFEQGHADFSRINGKRDLVVSDVAHKAFFEVNEEGAEAAAATGVVIVPTSVQLPVTFNANRPFLFMIYDKEYQLVLFAGVVNKPWFRIKV